MNTGPQEEVNMRHCTTRHGLSFRVWAVAALLVVGLLSFSTAHAQATGGLQIKVVDDAGEPLPGATVTLSHETGSIKTESSSTGRDGVARFPVLPAGSGYIIEVGFPTFATQRQQGQRVKIGEQSTIVIKLSAAIEERVTVVATESVVDLDKTTASTKFSDEFLGDLPVAGNFYQNALTLAPGVNDADGDGNPNVHGSRSRDFKAVISGVSNVDPLTGQFMSLVNQSTIDELEVITGGAGVEFGRAQGGFANIVQKQGTNEFEGVFDFLYRSSTLDGTGANDFSNLPDPEFETTDAGLLFSGPLVRDKLWFRLSQNRIDREDPVNILGGIAVTTNKRVINSDSITWQASPRNRLQLQYQSDPLLRGNVGISSFTPIESSWTVDNTSDTWLLNWTAPYSTKILVNSTFSHQKAAFSVRPTQLDSNNECALGDNPLLRTARCFNLVTGETTGSFFQDVGDSRERFTAKTSATIYGGQFWGANHQFKMGFDVENERYFRRRDRGADLTYFELTFLDSDDPNATPELFRRINANLAIPGVSDIRSTGNNFAFYVEDQIKPLSNLTMTIGARIDREEINSNGAQPLSTGSELDAFTALAEEGVLTLSSIAPLVFTSYEGLSDFQSGIAVLTGLSQTEVLQRFAPVVIQSTFWNRSRRASNIDIANTNISPFFSVKWDPWSNGKTSLGGSYRRYYDKIILGVTLQELESPTTNLFYDVTVDGDGNQTTRLNSAVNPSVNVQAVDRNLKTPYQDEFRMTFEREIFQETALNVEYLRRNYRDQLQDIDVNRKTGDFGRCKVATPSNNETVILSPGTGEILDPYSGLFYMDTDPGNGDGLIDDCSGELVVDFGGSTPADPFAQEARLEKPDGVADLYVQNPGWGSIFLVGNFNEADYEAFIVSLTRRQYRSWEMQASYTWSMAKGNGEDFAQSIGDDISLVDDEFGFQSNDQRHVVRMNATTITPWGFRLGGTVRWESGLPYSVLERRLSFDTTAPVLGNLSANSNQVRFGYPTGVRNDQRNASMWTFDLKATKEMNIARGMNLQLSAEIFNLLNDDTLIVYNNNLESGRSINGTNESFRRFGRSWQLGMKLAF